MEVKNYFEGDFDAAARYARARPYFHPLVINRLRKMLGTELRDVAVDVGCGTGQSSVALAELAKRVIGIDASREMLRVAMPHPAVTYLLGSAEAMPLGASTADIVTAGLALHWFSRMEFLREAARVLRARGWLITYTDHFSDIIVGLGKMELWQPPNFASQFPAVGKDRSPITPEQAQAAGFEPFHEETIEYELLFELEQFITYLTTQSNILAAIQCGPYSLVAIENGLRRQLAPHFASRGPIKLLFTASIAVFQKTGRQN